MNRRFFIENQVNDNSVTIDGPDAHHIVNVNRLRIDDVITLFDGSGREFAAKISDIKKKQVVVEITAIDDISREIDGQLTLAVSLPKGDRQKLLVEKLVELGVTNLIPLNCDRSVAVASDKSSARLQRRVIETSKQCGRNILMQIDPPVRFNDLANENHPNCQRFLAHPYDQDGSADLLTPNTTVESISPGQAILIAIGPEGGFTHSEVESGLQSGWQLVSLGKSILRVETAAVAAATLFGIGRRIS